MAETPRMVSYEFGEIFNAFWIGFRFDLLVLGFLSFPVLLTYLNHAWAWFSSGYWAVCILLMSAMISLDHQHYALFKDRVNAGTCGGGNLKLAPLVDPWSMGLWLCCGLFLALAVLLFRTKGNGHRKIFSWRWIVVFLVAGFMARGSLGPYHLDLRNAEFSKHKFLNLTAINSPYAFDQGMRERR